MSCTKCNETTITNHICAPKPCDIVTVCDCPTKLQTKCVTFEGDDLPITGIKKNTIETTMWQQLDAWLGKMREDIIKTFNIVNIGLGAKIYKGINLIGEKELKSITKTGSLITLTENTSDIAVGIDTTALTTFVTALSTTQKTYSAVNIGTGASVLKDSTTLLNNTQFNLRKITKKDLGVGASVIASVQESTLGTEIEIGVKKIKTDTLLITDGTADILINQKAITSNSIFVVDNNNDIKIEVLNLQKTVSTFPYTFTADDDKYTIFINNGAFNVTLQVPPGLPSNFCCTLIQKGTGDVTVAPTGVSILRYPSTLLNVIKGQYFWAMVEKETTVNEYYLIGSLKSI